MSSLSPPVGLDDEVMNITMLGSDDEVVSGEYPPLTAEQDMFALAVVEYSGNIAAAYRVIDSQSFIPGAKGKAMLMLPQVALRVRDLTEKIQDSALISMGAHLNELANIRDLAKHVGDLKVALGAERCRGEVAGLYVKTVVNDGSNGPVMIQINVASKYDMSI